MRYPETTAPITAPTPVAAPAFSAGSVIGRSFSIWFRNFVPFSIVTLVVHVPVLVLAGLAPLEGGPGWNVADRLLSGLASLVVTGALTYGVIASLRGGRAGLGTLFSAGFGKMGSVFAASFRMGLWLLLGTVLLVVPAIVWYCGLYVAVPVAVVEDVDSSDALERSRTLTKGHRWAIFAVVAVVFVVTILLASASGALVVLLEAVPHPIPVLLAATIIALVTAFGACAAAVAYHDLRVAKEGVTTEQLAKVFE